MSNRCADPFSLRAAPTGNKTSRRFPWWQSGVFTNALGDTITAGKQIRFRPPGPRVPYASGGQPLFNNPQPWPVFITEIRFLLVQYIATAETWYSGDFEDQFRKIGVKFNSSMQGNILKEFVPISCMATDPEYAQEFETTSATITLPDDYFLPSDADFGADLDIFAAGIFSSDAQLQVGLRGCDPYNNSPVARFSEVQSIAYAAGKSGNEFAISGLSGGQSVRNMWLRDLTFSLNNPFNTVTLSSYSAFWNQTLTRLYPPQGPKWSTDLVTPVSMLADQVPMNRSIAIGSDGSGTRANLVSHRPVTPYPLLPQDKFDIECIFNTGLTYAGNDYTTVFFVTMRGYQEVPSDAL